MIIFLSLPPFALHLGVSKDIFYSISSGDPDGYFTVDSASGTIRTALPLDHETCSSLELEIQARSGSPPAYGTSRVRITILDINDNAPTFLPSSSESILLPEITKMGTVIYRIQATDKDSGHNGQLSFDLVSAGVSGSNGQRTFGVDRGSGEVRLIGSLSYDSVPRYDLQVVAKDGGAPQLSSTFTLVVHIQAQDAQGPNFDTLIYRVELRENTPLNTRFLQVRALNREASGKGGSSSSTSSTISYRLRPDGDAAGFGIMPDSGWLFVRSAVDREVKDLYLLTVLATSGQGGAGRTGSATVRVTVTDENDNSPRLSQERVFLAVRENLLAGTGFGRVSATDRDAGLNAQLTYRLLHSDKHFQINSQTGTGRITTTAQLPYVLNLIYIQAALTVTWFLPSCQLNQNTLHCSCLLQVRSAHAWPWIENNSPATSWSWSSRTGEHLPAAPPVPLISPCWMKTITLPFLLTSDLTGSCCFR